MCLLWGGCTYRMLHFLYSSNRRERHRCCTGVRDMKAEAVHRNSKSWMLPKQRRSCRSLIRSHGEAPHPQLISGANSVKRLMPGSPQCAMWCLSGSCSGWGSGGGSGGGLSSAWWCCTVARHAGCLQTEVPSTECVSLLWICNGGIGRTDSLYFTGGFRAAGIFRSCLVPLWKDSALSAAWFFSTSNRWCLCCMFVCLYVACLYCRGGSGSMSTGLHTHTHTHTERERERDALDIHTHRHMYTTDLYEYGQKRTTLCDRKHDEAAFTTAH